MKVKVADNLYVADMEGCQRKGSEAIIHACKSPCFVLKGNSFDVVEGELDLYLNMIDPDKPMFSLNLFTSAIEFIDKYIGNRDVIIHCNQGKSRSASIAMLYLFSDETYRNAQDSIQEVYPYYDPSLGIDIFLEQNWEKLKIVK